MVFREGVETVLILSAVSLNSTALLSFQQYSGSFSVTWLGSVLL